MTEVQSTQMPITANSEVTNFDRMWSHIAYRRWAYKKAIAIKLNAATIIVVVKTSLDRVTLANEILSENVRDINVLMASVEAIQAAVGILLEH
jgi:hypothetical protein